LPVLSLVGDFAVDYMIAEGHPEVRLKTKNRIKHRGVYGGIATLLFHWVQEGKTESWRFDPSLPQPSPVQTEETTDSDGSQLFTITPEDLVPASGLLRGNWVGMFLAPAVHIDIPWGSDIWIFLFRSPWFPLKLSVAKSNLLVAHDQSTAAAVLTQSPGGVLSASLSSSGSDFKNASLVMKRRIGQFTSEEPICSVEAGEASQTWTPIKREFDLCLVTSSTMSMGKLAVIAKGLGADTSRGFLGPGSIQGDFVLCDGPLTQYSIGLRGDLGFLRHEEDSSDASLAW
jgi:hypothetical protein